MKSRATRRHEFKVGDKATVKTHEYDPATGSSLECARVVTVTRVGARVATDDGAVWFIRSWSDGWTRYGRGRHDEFLHPYKPGDQINVARYLHHQARERLESLFNQASSILEQSKVDLKEAEKRFHQASEAVGRARLELKKHDEAMPMKDAPELQVCSECNSVHDPAEPLKHRWIHRGAGHTE